jgi:hypothetical protein
MISSTTGGTTFSWTRNYSMTITGMPASGTGTSIAGTLVNNTTVPKTVIFTITPTNNGCAGTPITRSVTVNPAAMYGTSIKLLSS